MVRVQQAVLGQQLLLAAVRVVGQGHAVRIPAPGAPCCTAMRALSLSPS
eukprot:CAMPEP_0117697154 /NCGR_PEP_ID=MMETSP0804-20121206/29067_1 /TAXON_ID=1074897 /ORGANISM="Tetraselmis astigmatica, Strain CCMP880" /LENGTH=48 /DNA_ID= /DNA_START= /DNA_END= /DNA_ORIENTATION=